MDPKVTVAAAYYEHILVWSPTPLNLWYVLQLFLRMLVLR